MNMLISGKRNILGSNEQLLDHFPQWVAPSSIGSNPNLNHLCIVSVLLFVQCTNYCPLVSNSFLPKLLMRTNIHKQILPGLKFSFFLYLLHYPGLFIDYQLILHTYLIFVEFLPRLHDNETTFSGEWPSLAVISSLGHWNRFFSSWKERNQSLSLALPVPRAFGGIANKSSEGCSL